MKKTLTAAALATTLAIGREEAGTDERFLFIPPPPAASKKTESFEYEDRERFRFEFSKGTGRNNFHPAETGRKNAPKRGR